MDKAAARALVARGDRSGSGRLQWRAFAAAVAAEGLLAARGGRAGAARIFSLFDAAGAGRICAADIARVAAELAEAGAVEPLLADGEAIALVAAADRDADGWVTFDDFWRVLRRAEIRGRSGGLSAADEDSCSSDEDKSTMPAAPQSSMH